MIGRLKPAQDGSYDGRSEDSKNKRYEMIGVAKFAHRKSRQKLLKNNCAIEIGQEGHKGK